jgi:hypothetical protein
LAKEIPLVSASFVATQDFAEALWGLKIDADYCHRNAPSDATEATNAFLT